jgi:valacyclovir hydrolase
MPFLVAPNCTLYYDVYAQDFTSSAVHTVLLLHGFAGTPASDFADQLALLKSEYTVLAPHLHGYGLSSHRSGYTTRYYREDVADLIALLDTLGVHKVLALGFSDGGIVALLLAALHPARVEALAVLGAQPSIDAHDVAAIRYWLLERPLSEQWQAELATLHGEPYWRSLPPMYVAAQEALVKAGGVLVSDAELAAIRCPTLIMHGERDRIVSSRYARLLAERIRGARLLLFDAGHAAHLRCEQEYTQAVQDLFPH